MVLILSWVSVHVLEGALDTDQEIVCLPLRLFGSDSLGISLIDDLTQPLICP